MNEFGQTPKQIFKTPHPKRFLNKVNEIYISQEDIVEVNLENSTSLNEQNEESKLSITEEKKKSKGSISDEILNKLNINLNEEKDIVFNFDRNYISFPKFHKK